MSCQHVYLAFTICILAFASILVGSLGKDANNEQNIKETEQRLLARLIEAERQKWDSLNPTNRETTDRKDILENGDTTESEVETVQRVDSDRMKIDITLDNKLIEQRLLDCKQEYELIIVNADGKQQRKDVCYIHKMEKELSESVCKENKEKLQRNYKVEQEVKDKDFLSQDGPDSVCRTRPMYKISPADNMDQDVPARELNKRSHCSPYCCQYGWWWGANTCKRQCVVC